ncbi:MAG: hypothetical protein C4308_00335 [Chitinophagaceae bacterium]
MLNGYKESTVKLSLLTCNPLSLPPVLKIKTDQACPAFAEIVRPPDRVGVQWANRFFHLKTIKTE